FRRHGDCVGVQRWRGDLAFRWGCGGATDIPDEQEKQRGSGVPSNAQAELPANGVLRGVAVYGGETGFLGRGICGGEKEQERIQSSGTGGRRGDDGKHTRRGGGAAQRGGCGSTEEGSGGTAETIAGRGEEGIRRESGD